MKHIQDLRVPLYGPGSTSLNLPVDGEIKGLFFDPETDEWGLTIEGSVTVNSYSRFIDVALDYVSSPMESTYNFVGKLARGQSSPEVYAVWWREQA
jgi:hypothetical protein